MNSMFSGCKSLEKINLSNLSTKNTINMSKMFYKCYSLKDLNLPFINLNNIIEIDGMFYGVSEKLSRELRNKYKIIREEAFEIQ